MTGTGTLRVPLVGVGSGTVARDEEMAATMAEAA
jgi:hypothetical protein